MTAPDRIWIDAWGGNWSPRAGGTQEIEYTRADLIPAALAVPEVQALVEAAHRAVSMLRACEAFINGCQVEPFTPTPDAESVADDLEGRIAALRGEGQP